MTDRERAIRESLGVPSEAEKVLVFGESSHWDPNWLLTAEEYYERRIRVILDAVIEELKKEPRRIYSLECVFFLKMFWDRNPDKQDTLRDLINQGRIRLTGSGVTTPDTLVPDTEALIRDYLIGQEWLRRNGMHQEPRIAYLPDDFGYPSTLPDVLHALGYDHVAVTRVDGMYFVVTDFRPRRLFPRPGSTAELLAGHLKTLDFIWRGPGGARVLCHWNAFGYFQGDMIALSGIIRWMGRNVGLSARSPARVARKIDAYIRQLSPLSPTPYMFCPIGCDFVDPIADLIPLLDSYNRTRYQDTGVYAVNGCLNDYMELVSCHWESLHELELDMNPYWMGFYSARPEMKQRCKKLCRNLVLAEKLLAATGHDMVDNHQIEQDLESAWEILAVSNHHDFITGTSPDKVWRAEQRPWLIKAETLARRAIDKASSSLSFPPSPRAGPTTPSWEWEDGRLVVTTPHYRIKADSRLGGCITEWLDPRSGASLLVGPGNDLVSYKDTGGLWRLGHEYWGGAFREREKASSLPAVLQVKEGEGLVEAKVESELSGMQLIRRMWFRNDSPVIRMSLTGSCAKRRTITCRFVTGLRSSGWTMDVAGGVVQRPLTKIYDPTFWPAANFAHFVDRTSGHGLAVFLGGPATVSGNSNGVLEWIALRNAPRERAFGFLPLLAHPASGSDFEEHTFEYAVWFTPKGDWRENKLDDSAGRVLSDSWVETETRDTAVPADDVVRIRGGQGRIGAVKKASRGEGLIVRLLFPAPFPGEVRLTCQGRQIRRALLCDARERDRKDIRVEGGEAVLPITVAVTTVRLLFQPAHEFCNEPSGGGRRGDS